MAIQPKDFYTMFDDHIFAPSLNKELLREWLKANKGKALVYVIFDRNLAPIYVGSSEVFDKRISRHRRSSEVSKVLDDVVFVGIKYADEHEDIDVLERQYIHDFEPTLNKHLYLEWSSYHEKIG